MSVRDVSELTCKEVVELVTEYLSCALDAEERVRFEQHLLVCPPCTSHLAQVRSTIGFAADLRNEISVASLPALLETFRSWKRK